MNCDVYAMHYVSSELPPRHYYCYESVSEAVRQLNNEGHHIELLYGENCEDLIGFIPTKYVPMSEEEVNTWFEDLRKYAIFNGKVNDVPYYDYYSSMLNIRAMEIGVKVSVKAYMNAGLLDDLS